MVVAEKGEDLFVEPGLMPELQRRPAFLGQQAEKITQAGEIFAKERRELEQQGAGFLAQCAGGLQKISDVIFDVLEFFDVRDSAGDLQHENELVRNLGRPIQ